MYESFNVTLESQTVSRVEHVLEYSMNLIHDIAVIAKRSDRTLTYIPS